MDAVVLTWRWQNILAIWIMVCVLYLAVMAGSQVMLRYDGGKAAKDA